MKTLHIYPTSRVLRHTRHTLKEQNGFLPTLIRMDEFKKRFILFENYGVVDGLRRTLFLKEATAFKAFEEFKIDRDLVRFFGRSEAIIKFFEEMAEEKIVLEQLKEADAYAEFEEHLDILERLRENYRAILNAHHLTDRMFFPDLYRLNMGFLSHYQKIELFLEGYLTRFELELFEEITPYCEVLIHYTTSAFASKMQDRFEVLGISLPNESHVTFDLGKKSILKSTPNDNTLCVNVFSLKERIEQVGMALMEIEKMVQKGISPENIALVLPDESFKTYFTLYDTHRNLNFAMGRDFSTHKSYKQLEALQNYWRGFGKEERKILERFGTKMELVDALNLKMQCDVGVFFETIENMLCWNASLTPKAVQEKISQSVMDFSKSFRTENLLLNEWLFLWLRMLSEVTLDDLHGGKVTVMGVLETRGVRFDGVVVVDFNDGIVPAISSKDQFLNTQVRAFAALPTRNDRESLQKYYYKRLLEQAKEAVILYTTSNNRLPSKFIYELGLRPATSEQTVLLSLLYDKPLQKTEFIDPVVVFDAHHFKWSATMLGVYLTCKRKFYYRYIEKIKAKQDEEINEGKFLHTLLHHLFKIQNHFKTQKEMETQLYQMMESMLPDTTPKMIFQKSLWREKLKGFIQTQLSHFNEGWRVIECEKTFYAEIGGLRFEGRIDRIDQNATHTLVIDYKSGTVQKEPKTLNPDKVTDFQMAIYHILLKNSYTNLSLAHLKLFENGQMQPFTLQEEMEKLLGEYIVTLKQTTSFVAEKCASLSHCRYCEYTLMCERGAYL